MSAQGIARLREQVEAAINSDQNGELSGLFDLFCEAVAKELEHIIIGRYPWPDAYVDALLKALRGEVKP